MGSHIPSIEALKEPPVVGKFYMVPCVEVSKEHRYQHMHRPGIFPVTGTKHEDSEIVRFPHYHWHYDFRFFDRRQWDAFLKKYKSPFSYALCTDIQNYITKGFIENPGISTKPVLMLRRCMREQAEPPAAIPDWSCASAQRLLSSEQPGRTARRTGCA
jgi:hypothetical protein